MLKHSDIQIMEMMMRNEQATLASHGKIQKAGGNTLRQLPAVEDELKDIRLNTVSNLALMQELHGRMVHGNANKEVTA